MDSVTTEPQSTQDYRFIAGLLAGAVIGAGLMMVFAPETAAELRRRMKDSAKALANRATDTYQQATTKAGDAMSELTRKGQGLRDDVADTVARKAHEVERFATAVKSRP